MANCWFCRETMKHAVFLGGFWFTLQFSRVVALKLQVPYVCLWCCGGIAIPLIMVRRSWELVRSWNRGGDLLLCSQKVPGHMLNSPLWQHLQVLIDNVGWFASSRQYFQRPKGATYELSPQALLLITLT